ncbi:MAG TPA: hypothetical protein VNK04_17395 [Gemmataceae bacterium]|nr:hypothetical protein [Gemmataceae bacterium]
MKRKLIAATLLVALLSPLAMALAFSAVLHVRLAAPAEAKEFPTGVPLVFLEEDEREFGQIEIEVLRPPVSTEVGVLAPPWPATVVSAADAFPTCPIYYRLLRLLA